jgi:hypothetical protein
MYSLSTPKHFLLSLVVLASLCVTASAYEQSSAETSALQANLVSVQTVNLQSSGMQIQSCPKQFYAVELPTDGKLCQVFAADLPASMILFVPKSPSDVISFYKRNSAKYSITKQVKDRYFMQSGDKNTTLIISSDGSGTQVDILVKKNNLL